LRRSAIGKKEDTSLLSSPSSELSDFGTPHYRKETGNVLIVLKSWSLNLLEPSGPVQVCNGIALPLPFLRFYCEDVIGEWKKLHNEELNGVYSSPNIVRVIKSRMR
jgi:hypothetical protein